MTNDTHLQMQIRRAVVVTPRVSFLEKVAFSESFGAARLVRIDNLGREESLSK